LVSPFGHTNRTSYPTISPLSSARVRLSKRGEAEDFATPSAQDRLPTIEARRDSSIQLPSGSRIIDIRAMLPSVTGARPNLVASAAAIIFTMPKDGTLTGATRCIKRLGLLRGDTVKMRYRRLDFECTRTKTEASIAVSRGTDE
jgi:hypothetical protein